MLYTIERDFSGYTDEQLVSAGFRALFCITFFPGMRWLRSYYDHESQQARCFYEAPSDGDLRHHSKSMAIPIGDVRPVVELRPGSGGGFQFGEPNDTSLSRDETGAQKLWVVRMELEETQVEDVGRRFLSDGLAPLEWVRSFVDQEASEVFAVYRSAEHEVVQKAIDSVGFHVRSLEESEETIPADLIEPSDFTGK